MGHLFPICCVTDIPAEVLNEILESTYEEGKNENPKYFDYHLVVIDRELGEGEPFTEATIPPVSSNITSSPFKGKTPTECAQLLAKEAQREGSEVEANWIVILDERTLRDSTAFIAGKSSGCEEDESGRVIEVERKIIGFRCVSETIQRSLEAMSQLKPELQELVRYAEQEEDGVLK